MFCNCKNVARLCVFYLIMDKNAFIGSAMPGPGKEEELLNRHSAYVTVNVIVFCVRE